MALEYLGGLAVGAVDDAELDELEGMVILAAKDIGVILV
jgi:hypothetical protein